MLVAGFVVDKGDFFGEGEMPFAYAAILFTIFLAGPGKLSLDHYFLKRATKPAKIFTNHRSLLRILNLRLSYFL